LPDDVDQPADEDLVRRVLSGDPAAAGELHRRHEPRLRARARRRAAGKLSRKLGASDIVQDTYLAVFEDLASFEDRGPGSFQRWLDGVFECRATDAARRHVGAAKRDLRREVSPGPDASQSGPPARGASPSVEAASNEERERLVAAVDAMEGDDRDVLRLVHVDGKDFAEAGRVLGRSAEAARKLYSRAVVRLGRRMRRPR
jgi:RNA polymerase sigma-70 factor (ECF subfamily)